MGVAYWNRKVWYVWIVWSVGKKTDSGSPAEVVCVSVWWVAEVCGREGCVSVEMSETGVYEYEAGATVNTSNPENVYTVCYTYKQHIILYIYSYISRHTCPRVRETPQRTPPAGGCWDGGGPVGAPYQVPTCSTPDAGYELYAPS